MRLARHVALTEKMENTVSSFVGKHEGKDVLLGYLYVDKMIILKQILKKLSLRILTGILTHYTVQKRIFLNTVINY